MLNIITLSATKIGLPSRTFASSPPNDDIYRTRIVLDIDIPSVESWSIIIWQLLAILASEICLNSGNTGNLGNITQHASIISALWYYFHSYLLIKCNTDFIPWKPLNSCWVIYDLSYFNISKLYYKIIYVNTVTLPFRDGPHYFLHIRNLITINYC